MYKKDRLLLVKKIRNLISDKYEKILNDIVSDIDFKIYTTCSDDIKKNASLASLNAFIGDGDYDTAYHYADIFSHKKIIKTDDLVDFIMNNNVFDKICKSIFNIVINGFHKNDYKEIYQLVFCEVYYDVFYKFKKFDNTDALDLLNEQTILVSYIPLLSEKKDLNSCLINFSGETCEVETIIPDENFESFLKLINLNSDDYIKAVKKYRNIDLLSKKDVGIEKAKLWNNIFYYSDNDCLFDDMNLLLDSIDCCSHGFIPMLAFNVNARWFIERDWNKFITLSNGVIGLHNPINGSGSPLQFKKTLTIFPKLKDIVVSEGNETDFNVVYGFDNNHFDVDKMIENLPVLDNDCFLVNN